MSLESGHSAGTVAPETRTDSGRQRSALDTRSSAPQGTEEGEKKPKPKLPGWGRLLDLDMAAAYVGLSPGMLREYVNDGTLSVTRPARPNTQRAHGIRAGKRTRRTVASEQLRRLLFDVRDLDALVDAWKRGA